MKRGKRNQDKRKKEQRRLEKKYSSSDTSYGKWITIGCVVLVFVLFYFFTIYLTNKRNSKASDESSEVKFSEIILGRSFSMKDSEYLVLYCDSSDEETMESCTNLLLNYQVNHGEGSIYYVNMNNGFNKAYKTEEESNKNPSSVSELLINGPTLIKVNEHKAVEYIEGIDEITNYLNS